MKRGARSAGIQHLGLAGACTFLLLAAPANAQQAQGSGETPAAAAEPAQPTVEQCVELHERAQVLRIDGQLLESRAALGTCAGDACPDPLKQDCVTWREEVSQQIPTVIFEAITNHGAAAVATVSANGRELTRTLDGHPMELDPGHYQFRFELPDGSAEVVSALIKPGGKNVVVSADFRSEPPVAPAPAPAEPVPTATLPPELPPPLPHEGPPRHAIPTGTYVLGALALAGTGVAIGLGVSTNTKQENSLESCAPKCSQNRVDEITTLALMTDISIGVAIGSTIGAALIYAYSNEEQWRAVSVAPTLFYVPDGTAYTGFSGSF